MKKYIFGLSVFVIVVSAFTQQSFAKGEVNVYSYRQPILIDPFFEEFTNQTGIKVNVLHAKKLIK